MEHREIISKLSAFLDNELHEPVKKEVKSHLGSCSECSKEYEILAAQREYLIKAPAIEPAAAFRAEITAKIDTQKAAKPALGFGKLIPVPLALSALVLIFSAYMIVAPVAYGMNIESVKPQAKRMAINAVLACECGGIFTPAAFAKFCGACTANACTCCDAKCGTNCKMKMKTGGCEHGNEK
ncbi:MAG: zf-HC2 domain-containing protein [Candidatus Goldiibacteriota bacterium]|jgi:anti-sigma factor RsiW